MAYILGYWFADGYMRKDRSYRIVFTSNDLPTILQIRRALNSTHPIRKDPRYKAWIVSFCSKHMFQKLSELGGIRAKSRIVKFPDIPGKYKRDFIRGYFDGDGSVFFVRYVSTKNHKPRKELRSNFTSGSRAFLNKLMEVLNQELGLNHKKLGVYNNGGSLKLGYGSKETKTLLEYIYYKNFPIGLQRKSRFLNLM